MSTPDLAIIVPAYRGRYLHAALASVAAQTDQRFALYVCDDGSPEDLGAIYRSVFPAADENRTFIRFAENLGGTSLVAQWNRCVSQARGERWIWLFSDDDLLDPRCVAAFHQASNADQSQSETASVYRFNTTMIDGQDYCIAVNPPHPERESTLQFVYHRMLRQRHSYAPEYIFAHDAFVRCGGFVAFPFALGSDDASWISFAGDGPLRTIEGPCVYWRFDGKNTSSITGRNTVPKLLGILEFTVWLEQRFGKSVFPEGKLPSRVDLSHQIRRWFFHFVSDVNKLLSLAEIEALVSAAHEKGGFTKLSIRLRLYRSNWRFVGHTLLKSFRSWLR